MALIDFAMALHDTDLSAVTGARGKQGSGLFVLIEVEGSRTRQGTGGHDNGGGGRYRRQGGRGQAQ